MACDLEVRAAYEGSRRANVRSSLGVAAGLTGGRVCAIASITSSARAFEWHGKCHSIAADSQDCMRYLSVTFPPTMSTNTRRVLHSLAQAAGLECVVTGPKAMRQMCLGTKVDCDSPAMLTFPTSTELTIEAICLILAINFGLESISEEDIT